MERIRGNKLEDIIHYWQHREELDRVYDKAEKAQAKIGAVLDELDDVIDIIDQIDEVFDGVPLSTSPSLCIPFGIKTKNKAEERSAHVYQNANDKDLWGLRIRDGRGLDGVEAWCGCNWGDEEEVILAAKNWVVHKTIPLMDGKDENKNAAISLMRRRNF